MRLAGFEKDEDGHQSHEAKQRAVFENFEQRDFFGDAETTAIYFHVQKISAENSEEKSGHDESYQAGPDAQLPANQEKQSKGNFGKRKRMGNKVDGRFGQKLIRIHLHGEKSECDAKRRALRHRGHSDFGVAGIYEKSGKEDPANQDESAAKVEWRRLHHR